MKTSAKIISVDPGRDTLGVLNGKHLEFAARLTGATSYENFQKEVEDPYEHVCRLLFASRKTTGGQSLLLLAGRVVTAAAIFFAATSLDGAASVALYCLIPLLLFGFLTRPASLAGALIAGVGSAAAGIGLSPAVVVAVAGCCLLLATGAGRISIDRPLMRSIIRNRRNRVGELL